MRLLNLLRRRPARTRPARRGYATATGVRAGGIIGRTLSVIPPSLRSYG